MGSSHDETPRGRRLRLDATAQSASPDHPAFLARPEGAPVYHGFPLVEGAEVDGFQLGMITDFLAEPDTTGDAFVVAPDGSRAGLVWEAEADVAYFREVLAPDSARWGVWAVGLPAPMRTVEDARRFLAALLPELRRRWDEWARAKPH